ncbi:MFS transporter [Amycolatopsis sp. cmx-4-68]|uniref:MFS transporter n=1 Tax=Amycolatopsis sp. cmx-4-68 TaxID=2790938 RepID=UPI00397C3B59
MNGAAGPEPRRWLALAVISVAQLLMVLNDSVINIALPSAACDLGMTDASRAWAITAYVLPFGGLLLLSGRVADTVGRRRALGIGLLGFAAASVVGGLATSAPVFFAARAGQGVFAALVTPAALALITMTFPDPRERARPFGVYGAISGAGAALGVIAGGVLTEFVSWRWRLLVNVPIAVVARALTIFAARESRVPGQARYDVGGAMAVTAGLTALVWVFTRAADPGTGWRDAGTLLALAGGAVLIVVFVLIERAATSPLVPLRLILERNGVGHADVGTMSALLNTAQQVGGALGAAVLNSVYTAAALTIGLGDPGRCSVQADLPHRRRLVAVAFAVPAILTSSHRIPSMKESLA